MWGRGYRIGSVFGFELRLDLSVIFLVMLITFHFGAGLVPSLHPDWSPLLGWSVALAAAALFVVSIGIHELSHALVGRSFGIPVRSITFFLFGGVSNIEREPPSARSEFFMAVVGPVTSIGLGFILLLAGGGMLPRDLADGAAAEHALQALGPVPTLLLWLGSINLLLGVFNLIPGFPLDGGRILRSIVWKVTGSLDKATRWAAASGRAVGWAFVGLGALMAFGYDVPFFGTGFGGGLWLAFIGWFLARAARASVRQLVLHRALEGVAVGSLMRRDVATVPSSASVASAVDAFTNQDTSELMVVEHDQLLGVVTVGQVRGVAPAVRGGVSVREIMTPRESATLLAVDGELEDAVKQMMAQGAPSLPVVDGEGHPEGVLRLQDVARWIELHGADDPDAHAPRAA
ncbi:MAG: site-2 protease family protein [Deltaproteobacteria bacterium]|nr:site-2 protease family protein [Deltaproteobacteria bacterium]